MIDAEEAHLQGTGMVAAADAADLAHEEEAQKEEDIQKVKHLIGKPYDARI